MLGHEAKVHARLLIHLVAARRSRSEQSREQIGAGVQRNHPAHDSADFQIEEWRDQLFNKPRAGNVIRVENQDDFGLTNSMASLSAAALPPLPPARWKG